MSTDVFSPVTLPCSGRRMNNRLVKVALYEHLAKMHGGPPNNYHIGLYTEWAKHEWGMIVTGNVQVSRDHLTLGRDLVVPQVLDEGTLAPFKTLARTMHAQDSREPSAHPLALMQLSHAGRQSPNFLGGRKLGVPPMAPSPVRLGSNMRVRSRSWTTSLSSQTILRVLFQRPREMTLGDIKGVQQAFIRGALAALEAGFDGVQLHCAHGYLLAQFLNPKSNVRRDGYSSKSPDALRMVREIVEGIRAVAPKDFVIGLKINSADYMASSEEPSDRRILKEARSVLDHIRTIALWEMVDFIEISGGDYESPDFMSTKTTSPRQALFARFAQEARECLKTNFPAGFCVPLILLTGGLRSPAHMQTALDAGHADLLGLGRSSILRPDIPAVLRERILSAAASATSIMLDDRSFSPEPSVWLPFWTPSIPLVGANIDLAWYQVRLRRIATSQLETRIDGNLPPAPLPTFRMAGMESMLRMWVWLEWYEILIGASIGSVAMLAIVWLML